jgi:prolyl-tRNA synthetase
MQKDPKGYKAAKRADKFKKLEEIKKKAAERKSTAAGGGGGGGGFNFKKDGRDFGGVAKEGAIEKAAELGAKHDMVIVPIFWKRNEEEAARVIDCAREIKKLMLGAGLDIWVDERHKYTPGQKFAYWEHLGIQLRVEVGPKEAENRTCIMAWTKTPGEYATVRKESGVPLTKQAILEKAVEMGMTLGAPREQPNDGVERTLKD